MVNEGPFYPTGSGTAITAAVANSTPTAVQLSGPQVGSQIQVRAINSSSSIFVGLAFASSAAAANVNGNLGLPTSGSPQPTLVLAPSEVRVFTVPPGQYWTAVSASSTVTVYLQPGLGVS